MSAAATRAAPSPPAQLQLEARLFHSGTGRLSADVLATGGPDLVNVVASADPSRATLVVVVVKLAADTALRAETPLRLVVAEQAGAAGNGRVLFDGVQPVGPIATGGTTHLGFWVRGTGCRPLNVQASLVIAGQAAPASIKGTVPFRCGE